MILRSLHVTGFGRLVDRRFTFAPGLNVVYGPNESGKSTLANAVIATLYGLERKKETWRPWASASFGTTLDYDLSGGERIEVQRDFDRDAKGLRVYDRNGNDISGRLAGHKLVPGEAHLGVPIDVFTNAACMKQQAMAIDDGKDAAPIAAQLARALDGGPRDDAALGALTRLDEALRTHVGTERARKHAPLRNLRVRAVEQEARMRAARARLTALDDLRLQTERTARDWKRLEAAGSELERRLQSLRAGAIARRLENLRAFRAEIAELQTARSQYDDVAAFDSGWGDAVNAAFGEWEFARRSACAARVEADAAALDDGRRGELEARRRDVGRIDDTAYAALVATEARRNAATIRATAAAREAAAARAGRPHRASLNAGLCAVLITCVAIGFAIAHSWTFGSIATALSLAALAAALSQHRTHSRDRDAAAGKQSIADAALEAQTAAADEVRSVLDPFGMRSFEELAAHRTRYGELLAAERHAQRLREHATIAEHDAQAHGRQFDDLTMKIAPDAIGPRAERKASIVVRAARRREYDGLGAHIHGLQLQRSSILGEDDEAALEAELAGLQSSGVAAADGTIGARRELEAQRLDIAARCRTAGQLHSRLSGELDAALAQLDDLAALDEELARTQSEIVRIATFERAIMLAKSTLEQRTNEAHQTFARRLEDYAAAMLGEITGGRYTEIFVDPKTLSIRVRVPETQAIVELEALSAGTRDQAYLVVRFAMARIFAEGMERPPMLMDDPFAYWDATRIERCLPVLKHGARDGQALLFTANRQLADAAIRDGAHCVDLPQPALT